MCVDNSNKTNFTIFLWEKLGNVNMLKGVKCDFSTKIYHFARWKLFWKEQHKPIQNHKIVVVWPNVYWTLADVCHRK